MRLTSASEAAGCSGSCLGNVGAAEEEGGKILELTRRVRGMQAVRGKGEPQAWPHPGTGGPGFCEKFHQLGSYEKCPQFIGGFPFWQSLKELPQEMINRTSNGLNL